MNEKNLVNEHSGTQAKAEEFIGQKTQFWGASRRRAIQLLATGAGVTATLGLSAFYRGKVTIAAEAGAKQGNKQANNRLQPNLFELQGYNTRIVYSTTVLPECRN